MKTRTRSSKTSKLRQIEQDMARAVSYDDWFELAENHDRETGADLWRRKDESRQYDSVSIGKRLRRLRGLRRKGDDHGLLFALNEGIHGNMAGMGRPGSINALAVVRRRLSKTTSRKSAMPWNIWHRAISQAYRGRRGSNSSSVQVIATADRH